MSEEKTSNAVALPKPQGFELGGGISFHRLNPLAGELARSTGEPQFCGYVVGHISSIDLDLVGKEYGNYNRFNGDFWALSASGSEMTGGELYLPSVPERFYINALNVHGPGVPVQLEAWAYKDESGRKGGSGYFYRAKVLQEQGQMPRSRLLAVRLGIVPGPAPVEFPAHDLVTGELLSEPAPAKAGVLDEKEDNFGLPAAAE